MLPAINTTQAMARPMPSSYEITWAEARKPPSVAYLLLLAQPASAMPYTATPITPIT